MNLVKMISILIVNIFSISLMAQTINAPIEPVPMDPIPGISPNAVGVYVTGEKNGWLYFEEGVEFRYPVYVRLYLPDLEFDAELVDAPDGMNLVLLAESKKPGSEKIYEIVWEPSFDVIPDTSIPSIVRFFKIRVNVGLDKNISKEIRYTLYNHIP